MQQPPFYAAPPPLPKQNFFQRPVPVWLFFLTIILVTVIIFFLAHSIPNSTATTLASTTPTTAQTSSSSGGTATSSINGSTTHSYKGPGNLKTDPITIAGSTWQMNWTCDPNSFDGMQWNFSVSLYHTDGTMWEPYAINELCSPGITSGHQVEYQGGTFYLEIIAEGNWSLTIQEES